MLGEHLADHDIEADADESHAEALDGATHQEDLHRRRETGDEQPRGEDPHAGSQGEPGTRRSINGPAIVIDTTATAVGAANDRAYRLSPSSSSATTGMTVITASDSNATRNASEKMPATTRP